MLSSFGEVMLFEIVRFSCNLLLQDMDSNGYFDFVITVDFYVQFCTPKRTDEGLNN